MESGWLLLVALAFGFLVGSAVVVVIVLSYLRGRNARAVVSGAVPAGVEAVIDALELAGVVVDPSNNVVKASPAAYAYGMVWQGSLAHPKLTALVDQVRRTGEPVTEELEVPRGPFGDAVLHLLARVARVGTRHVLVLAEDRTESFRLDEVRRDFVANISHELKTPIGAVSLLAEALEAASDEPEQVKRFAKRLTKESDRLARITQELIELSRLQSIDVLDQAEVVKIDRVLAAAVDQTRVAADASRVRVVVGGDKGARVMGDEAMLTTAVQNLLDNAVRYSAPKSRVGIGVKAGDGVVEIAIADQGVGITEDEVDRVFERFFRSDPARSRNTGGSGIGLAIVKHVVSAHGGDIKVWSQAGRGSTFTIRLPEAAIRSHPMEGTA